MRGKRPRGMVRDVHCRSIELYDGGGVRGGGLVDLVVLIKRSVEKRGGNRLE